MSLISNIIIPIVFIHSRPIILNVSLDKRHSMSILPELDEQLTNNSSRYNLFGFDKEHNKTDFSLSIESSSKRLIVLGNGFDIAHNLKTTFSDFREFMVKTDKLFVNKIEEYTKVDQEWNKLEDSLSHLEAEDFREVCYPYIEDLTSKDGRDSSNHAYQQQIDLESEFISSLAANLKYWIISVNVNTAPVFKKELFEGECYFLTFNYTHTLETVYNIPNSDILYVHGDVEEDDILIVGHNDKGQTISDKHGVSGEEDWRVKEGDEILYSRLKLLYKNSEDIIERNTDFFARLADVSEIYVIGHSMSHIDAIYFHHIMESVSVSCIWNITYYGADFKEEQNKYSEMMQKITELGIKKYNLIRVEDLYQK